MVNIPILHHHPGNQGAERRDGEKKMKSKSRREDDERRVRRHLPDRNPNFNSCHRQTNTRTHNRGREREDDSFMLPTVDDAKMIIAADSLQ